MTSSSGADDVDPARCQQIADLLRGARGVVAEYAEQDPGWDGTPQSQLAAERIKADQPGGERLGVALSQAISIAQLYVFAMLQHLDALGALFETDPPPAYAIGLVARSVVELGARSWWISDPDVTMDIRVARGFIEKLASLRDIERGRDSGDLVSTTDAARSYDAAALIADVRALGIEADTRGGRIVVGSELRPSATKLVGRFLERDTAESRWALYRLLSANAHGTLWAVTMHFTADFPIAAPPSAIYRVTQDWLDGPANIAFLALCRTVERFCVLLGWTREPVLALLRAADHLFG